MAEKIPSWIEKLLPRLSSMEELKAINTRIDSVNEMEPLRNELFAKNDSTSERVDSLRNEMVSMKSELKADIQRVDSFCQRSR